MTRDFRKNPHQRNDLRKKTKFTQHTKNRNVSDMHTSRHLNIKKYAFFFVIFILAAVPFTFGKYFELNYPDPYDSAAYVYSAEMDNKFNMISMQL